MKDVKFNLVKIFFVISYLGMLAMNIGANWLLLNGTTTGEVTTDLKLSFEPAGFTFSIWGLIYFLQLLSIFSYLKLRSPLPDMEDRKEMIQIMVGSGVVCLLQLES